MIGLLAAFLFGCGAQPASTCRDDDCRLQHFQRDIGSHPEEAIAALQAIEDPVLVTAAVMELVQNPPSTLTSEHAWIVCSELPGESNVHLCRRKLDARHLRPGSPATPDPTRPPRETPPPGAPTAPHPRP